jgi:hypothetical protein
VSGRDKYRAARGRKDANHAELARAYEELFCNVLDLSGIGFGCPDTAIGCAGRMELVEFKTEDGDTNEAQKRFASTWRGPRIVIARTRADVLTHVQDLRRRVARG